MSLDEDVGEGVATRLKRIRHVLLDMDGTIYRGRELFPATRPFLELLGGMGIGHSFITNNSSLSVEGYLSKLSSLGLAVEARRMYTSTLFAADYIRGRMPEVKRLFVLGTKSMKEELARFGFDVLPEGRPDAVIVGSDIELDYDKLCRAAHWICSGAEFVATHPDRLCPSEKPDFMPIDCGLLAEFLERACGRSCVMLGKPNPGMLEAALRPWGVAAEEAAVCGDLYETDVKLALGAGALAVQVLGPYSRREEPPPDVTVSDLMAFGRMLEQARGER